MSFEMEVEFSGLCMYLVDPENKHAAVLMPDCRKGVDPVHADRDKGVHHVGYLRFDLANLSGVAGVPEGTPLGGPHYEVVHRFNFQQLEFPDLPDEPVTIASLGFPQFEEFTQDLELKPGMFSTLPPKVLLMRTILKGGEVDSGRQKNWRLPPALKPGSDYRDHFASKATWVCPVPGDTVTIRIAGFDGADPVEFVLKPVEGEEVVHLKIANLCAVNPLEWQELELEELKAAKDGKDKETRDRDFKWLYRLLDSTSAPLPARLGEKPDLPVPVLEPDQGAGVQGCMGAVKTTTIPKPS